MGPQEEYVETVVTCKGDFYDPEFPAQLHKFSQRLQKLLLTGSKKLIVKKVEPWNSVRVTFNIPKEAAVRLRQLAEQGDRTLRDLGILAVQVEGDQIISLTIAGKNNEKTELVFRTTDNASSTTMAAPCPHEAAGPSNMDSSQRNMPCLGPGGAGTSVFDSLFRDITDGDRDMFKSPNVIAPHSDQLAFRQATQGMNSRASPVSSPNISGAFSFPPGGRPPPSYPSAVGGRTPSPVSPGMSPRGSGLTRQPARAMTSSSPLLVNLLQSDLSNVGHVNNLPSTRIVDMLGEQIQPLKKRRRSRKSKDSTDKSPGSASSPGVASPHGVVNNNQEAVNQSSLTGPNVTAGAGSSTVLDPLQQRLKEESALANANVMQKNILQNTVPSPITNSTGIESDSLLHTGTEDGIGKETEQAVTVTSTEVASSSLLNEMKTNSNKETEKSEVVQSVSGNAEDILSNQESPSQTTEMMAELKNTSDTAIADIDVSIADTDRSSKETCGIIHLENELDNGSENSTITESDSRVQLPTSSGVQEILVSQAKDVCEPAVNDTKNIDEAVKGADNVNSEETLQENEGISGLSLVQGNSVESASSEVQSASDQLVKLHDNSATEINSNTDNDLPQSTESKNSELVSRKSPTSNETCSKIIHEPNDASHSSSDSEQTSSSVKPTIVIEAEPSNRVQELQNCNSVGSVGSSPRSASEGGSESAESTPSLINPQHELNALTVGCVLDPTTPDITKPMDPTWVVSKFAKNSDTTLDYKGSSNELGLKKHGESYLDSNVLKMKNEFESIPIQEQGSIPLSNIGIDRHVENVANTESDSDPGGSVPDIELPVKLEEVVEAITVDAVRAHSLPDIEGMENNYQDSLKENQLLQNDNPDSNVKSLTEDMPEAFVAQTSKSPKETKETEMDIAIEENNKNMTHSASSESSNSSSDTAKVENDLVHDSVIEESTSKLSPVEAVLDSEPCMSTDADMESQVVLLSPMETSFAQNDKSILSISSVLPKQSEITDYSPVSANNSKPSDQSVVPDMISDGSTEEVLLSEVEESVESDLLTGNTITICSKSDSDADQSQTTRESNLSNSKESDSKIDDDQYATQKDQVLATIIPEAGNVFLDDSKDSNHEITETKSPALKQAIEPVDAHPPVNTRNSEDETEVVSVGGALKLISEEYGIENDSEMSETSLDAKSSPVSLVSQNTSGYSERKSVECCSNSECVDEVHTEISVGTNTGVTELPENVCSNESLFSQSPNSGFKLTEHLSQSSSIDIKTSELSPVKATETLSLSGTNLSSENDSKNLLELSNDNVPTDAMDCSLIPDTGNSSPVAKVEAVESVSRHNSVSPGLMARQESVSSKRNESCVKEIDESSHVDNTQKEEVEEDVTNVERINQETNVLKNTDNEHALKSLNPLDSGSVQGDSVSELAELGSDNSQGVRLTSVSKVEHSEDCKQQKIEVLVKNIAEAEKDKDVEIKPIAHESTQTDVEIEGSITDEKESCSYSGSEQEESSDTVKHRHRKKSGSPDKHHRKGISILKPLIDRNAALEKEVPVSDGESAADSLPIVVKVAHNTAVSKHTDISLPISSPVAISCTSAPQPTTSAKSSFSIDSILESTKSSVTAPSIVSNVPEMHSITAASISTTMSLSSLHQNVSAERKLPTAFSIPPTVHLKNIPSAYVQPKITTENEYSTPKKMHLNFLQKSFSTPPTGINSVANPHFASKLTDSVLTAMKGDEPHVQVVKPIPTHVAPGLHTVLTHNPRKTPPESFLKVVSAHPKTAFTPVQGAIKTGVVPPMIVPSLQSPPLVSSEDSLLMLSTPPQIKTGDSMSPPLKIKASAFSPPISEKDGIFVRRPLVRTNELSSLDILANAARAHAEYIKPRAASTQKEISVKLPSPKDHKTNVPKTSPNATKIISVPSSIARAVSPKNASKTLTLPKVENTSASKKQHNAVSDEINLKPNKPTESVTALKNDIGSAEPKDCHSKQSNSPKNKETVATDKSKSNTDEKNVEQKQSKNNETGVSCDLNISNDLGQQVHNSETEQVSNFEVNKKPTENHIQDSELKSGAENMNTAIENNITKEEQSDILSMPSPNNKSAEKEEIPNDICSNHSEQKTPKSARISRRKSRESTESNTSKMSDKAEEEGGKSMRRTRKSGNASQEISPIATKTPKLEQQPTVVRPSRTSARKKANESPDLKIGDSPNSPESQVIEASKITRPVRGSKRKLVSEDVKDDAAEKKIKAEEVNNVENDIAAARNTRSARNKRGHTNANEDNAVTEDKDIRKGAKNPKLNSKSDEIATKVKAKEVVECRTSSRRSGKKDEQVVTTTNLKKTAGDGKPETDGTTGRTRATRSKGQAGHVELPNPHRTRPNKAKR